MPQEHPDRGGWTQVDALLDELLDLEPGDRGELLRRVAERTPSVASRAEELLDAMDAPDDLFASPVAAALPDVVSGALETEVGDRSGQRLDAYRLIDVLGRGGMGVVYRAERADREFDKEVAIKLMPSGLESAEAERRFRIERQVLARLEHPGIARLLDGGVTDEGYPYLAMELVDGSPIDRHCAERDLGRRERVELFLDVCDAVQYAHQNLVIHRDLKPSNILVDVAGGVKLLDFGVAKLVEGEDATSATVVQPHTPGFASPEQLANGPVSTASDTYSLGLVLRRLVSQTVVSELETAATATSAGASQGGGQPSGLGDLGRIIAKALEAEPERRYPTAAAFADDLRRYLAGEPVTAREPTVGYRLRRFVGRHRTAVALSVGTVALLTLLSSFALWQAARARAEADRSNRMASLLTGLLVDANPWAPSGATAVSDLLDRGLARVDAELGDDAALRADVLSVLGQAYNGQDLPERGTPLLEEVLDERRRLYGDDDPRTAEAMSQLGYALLTADRIDEAVPLIEGAVEIAESRNVPDDELARRLFVLGLLRHEERDFVAGEEIFRRVVEARRSDPEPTATLALALGQLSVALDVQGRDAESLPLQREAVAVADATLGPGHPYTATLRNNLGVRLSEAGDYEAASVYYRQAVEVLEQRVDLPPDELAVSLSNLGRSLLNEGDFVGAHPYVERAVEITKAELPPDSFRRVGSGLNWATLLTELGELDEAERTYRYALDFFLERFGPDHQAPARVRCLLGSNLQIAGRLDEADEILSAALLRQRDPEQDPRSIDETLVALGRLRFDQGAFDEARSLLEEALGLRATWLPAKHWRIAEVVVELEAVAMAAGDADADRAEANLRILEATLPAGNFRLERGRRLLGQ